MNAQLKPQLDDEYEEESPHFARDPTLDEGLFSLLSNPTLETLEASSRARIIVQKLFAQDRKYLIRVIGSRANGHLDNEEIEALADKTLIELYEQVNRQLGGDSRGGLQLCKIASESTFKWCCAKLGRLDGQWGTLANAVRQKKKQNDRFVSLESLGEADLVSQPLQAESCRDTSEIVQRFREAKDGLAPLKAWVVDLWVDAKCYGIDIGDVLNLAYNNGLPRQPSQRRLRKTLRFCAKRRNLHCDDAKICELSYEELEEIANIAGKISLSSIQKLISGVKRRVRSKLQV